VALPAVATGIPVATVTVAVFTNVSMSVLNCSANSRNTVRFFSSFPASVMKFLVSAVIFAMPFKSILKAIDNPF
jgi:hypothetical protein